MIFGGYNNVTFNRSRILLTKFCHAKGNQPFTFILLSILAFHSYLGDYLDSRALCYLSALFVAQRYWNMASRRPIGSHIPVCTTGAVCSLPQPSKPTYRHF